MSKQGEKAPKVCLINQDKKEINLENYKGKWVVLYFYPKDSTPGCTQEAQEFNALKSEFENEGAAILGVSKDSADSHRKFADKYELKFDLLSDTEISTLEAYGVWGLKKMMGKEYMGITRTTLLISPEGNVAFRWDKVKVNGHVNEVLAKLKELKK